MYRRVLFTCPVKAGELGVVLSIISFNSFFKSLSVHLTGYVIGVCLCYWCLQCCKFWVVRRYCLAGRWSRVGGVHGRSFVSACWSVRPDWCNPVTSRCQFRAPNDYLCIFMSCCIIIGWIVSVLCLIDRSSSRADDPGCDRGCLDLW